MFKHVSFLSWARVRSPPRDLLKMFDETGSLSLSLAASPPPSPLRLVLIFFSSRLLPRPLLFLFFFLYHLLSPLPFFFTASFTLFNKGRRGGGEVQVKCAITKQIHISEKVI